MLIIGRKLLFFAGLAGLLILSSRLVFAQKSPDAIGLRIVTNPEHFSPIRWYNEKVTVKGAPLELLVDGYQAVRDGRTVYVGAANYVAQGAGEIYTNIYIISYNQAAEKETEDIFGQILAHWRFNTNLDTAGACSASSTIACINDSECAGAGFCSSLKAEVVRNTRRMADQADIETLLAKYKKAKGFYPKLSAGSYIANKTLSVWPSWQETLARELGASLPVDPVNLMGACPGFDPATCWNKASSTFAGVLPADPLVPASLPAGSQVYVYRVTPDGQSYTLSATAVDPLTIIGNNPAIIQAYSNVPPRIEVPPGSTVTQGGITYIVITAYPGRPFSYFVKAIDPDSDLSPLPLWTLNTGAAGNWTSMGWSAPPALATTTVANIKEIRAAVTGAAGSYYFSLTVTDGAGGTDQRNFRVDVRNQPPLITLERPSISVVVGRNDLVTNPYDITAVDPEGNYPLVSSFAPALPAGLVLNTVSNTAYRLSGIPTYAAGTYTTNYTVTFADSFNSVSTASFDLTIINNRPVFTSSPVVEVRVNNPYSYDAAATDADGHTVRFRFASGSGQPPTLSINTNSGLVSGTPTAPGSFNIAIEAYDGYGATTTQNYILTVTTYCGDGGIQTPNNEGVTEECDDGNSNNLDACGTDCKWTCQSLPASPFDPSNNIGDSSDGSVIYDDNDNVYDGDPVGGTADYLKVAKVIPTPYLWIANSNLGSITKLRTFDGWRRTTTGLDFTTWETMGQNLGTFRLISGPLSVANPSRTAVNAETGEVWVAGRDSGNVAKLDIEGNIKKICLTGAGARGVAIEESGDVWVANAVSANMVKLSGDDTDCAIRQTVAVGGYPYGLAVDSNNNIWMSNRGGSSGAFKYETVSGILTGYSVGSPYGITVDLDDNVWVAMYGSGIYRINRAGTVDYFAIYNPPVYPYYNSRGVSIDTNGSIWIAMDTSNQAVKIPDPTNPAVYSAFNTGGSSPVGMAGDSAGRMWAVNFGSGNASVFNSDGTIASSGSPFPSAPGSTPYTYSDMTGLNRAMLLRAGSRTYRFDSGFADQRWGALDWQEVVPGPKQDARVYVRAANIQADLVSLPWTEHLAATPASSAAARIGRYLEIRIELRSRERGVTPVLSALSSICLNPKGASGANCTVISVGACFGCTAACGGGTCTGSRRETDSCGRTYLTSCTITNSAPCPRSCNLPANLDCGVPDFSAPDRGTFQMASLPASYTINGGWGYTSVFPKPTSFPATVPSGAQIVVAVSSFPNRYYGQMICLDGTIYKNYASSSLSSTDICN